MFIGEVVAAYADDGIFNGTFNIREAKLIYHLGGDLFATLSDETVKPSY